MKKAIKILLFSAISLKGVGQSMFNDPICSTNKYDTLSADFIVEISASGYYYNDFDVRLQRNEIYFNHGYTKHSLNKMYNSDSIIVDFRSTGLRFFRDAKMCLNLYSLSEFESKIDSKLLNRKENKKLKKSIFKDNNGVKYLRINAKIIVIEMGRAKWVIPEIYSDSNNCEKEFTYCERFFNNTLILADIINWKFE